jgi:hypothetical protein
LVRIVAHLKTELQEVEAQLLALYEKRDGLRQVLGATIESTSNSSHCRTSALFHQPFIGGALPARACQLRDM